MFISEGGTKHWLKGLYNHLNDQKKFCPISTLNFKKKFTFYWVARYMKIKEVWYMHLVRTELPKRVVKILPER